MQKASVLQTWRTDSAGVVEIWNVRHMPKHRQTKIVPPDVQIDSNETVNENNGIILSLM